jgi:hypothetical protein
VCIVEDRSGARFERVDFRDARFYRIDFTGAEIRGALMHGMRMRAVELVDVRIDGELSNVVINGVDIAPLVEAELNRRMPERALMRPDTVDGFRRAWEVLTRLWDGTIARARTFPPARLHEPVGDEWSFTQTLRHLNFATACWVDRMILGVPAPWHELDLPWDEAPEWEGFPRDRDARPTLDEVLAVRAVRDASMRRVLATLTDGQLASRVTCTEPGFPRVEDFPFRECLLIVLNEHWEHRLFAERDLTVLTGADAPEQKEN